MEYAWIVQYRNAIVGLLIICISLDKINCNTIEHSKLTISPPVSEVVRFANDSHFVTCMHKKAQNGGGIHWYNPRGKEIADRRGRVHIEDKGTQTVDNLALVFEHISTADKGNWTCESKHDGKTSFKMIVNEPISFMDTPPIQSAREDKDATILCEVKGDPEPSVSWYYNGRQIILPGPKYTKLADGLVIKKVSKEDSGEYTCKAFQISTQISNVQEKTILLVIQHKPFFKQPRKNAYGYMHGVSNLTCEAMAEPPANFTWYRNGKKVSGKHYPIHHGQHISILSVTIANSSAFDEYKCKATNSMGSAEQAIKLEEGVKPDPPAVFFLRGVNSDTLDVDVGATKNPGPPTETDIIGYRFEIVTAEDFEATETWEKARQIDFPVEDGVTYLLTQLPEDKKFLVRVASRNAAGLSDWAPFKIFATLPLHPHGINGADNFYKSNNFLVLISMLFTFNWINR